MINRIEIFPNLILRKNEIEEHVTKILEILELDIEIKEDTIIIKGSRRNSSKAHKKFYEEFYNYYQGRK